MYEMKKHIREWVASCVLCVFVRFTCVLMSCDTLLVQMPKRPRWLSVNTSCKFFQRTLREVKATDACRCYELKSSCWSLADELTPSSTVAFFIQHLHIISGALVRQFSTNGDWHRAKHLKDEPLCNSHRKPVLQLLKRCDGTRHDDDVGVFSRCFPGVLLSI